MKRFLAIIAAFVLALSGCAPSEAPGPGLAPGKIRVGAFNIESFGTTKTGRPNTLTVLAQVASSFDVLAIEEVGSNDSSAGDDTCQAVMDAFVARINEVAESSVYSYVRDGQYAVVYRTDELALLDYGLYQGSQSFVYLPLTAYFKAAEGNFDFAVVVIHTRPSLAASEIPALRIAMAEVSTFYNEPDVICLGDFNADGDYYPEGPGPDLEGFPYPDYITAIPNSADTTVAASSRTYDRIELTSSLSTDYADAWGVETPGRLYDLSLCEGTERTAGTESALSDHYPVWAQFYTDRDTD